MKTKVSEFFVEEGSHFKGVSGKVKRMAKETNTCIYFNFNNVDCFVDSKTNLKNLYKDYNVALFLNTSSIGPKCVKDYSPEVQEQIRKKIVPNSFLSQKDWYESRLREITRIIQFYTLKGFPLETDFIQEQISLSSILSNLQNENKI